MDRQKPPISLRPPFGLTDADAAPIDSVREGSSIIYFASAEKISEGFAITLRAMGVGADILPANLAPPNTSSNEEDD